MLLLNKSVDGEKDQATELRKLISEVETHDVKKTANEERDRENDRPIDVLDLPPRKEVHSKNRSRMHLKLSNSILRLITVFIFVIAVIIGVIYLFENDLLEFTLFLYK